MEIRRVVPSGFCKGVVNAIKLAKNTREKYPNKKIYVLGMIVHNSYVTKELDQIGIITLDDSNTDKEALLDQIDEGVVIFTAHGIAPKIVNKAMDKGLICVDASCEDVLKTKDITLKYLEDGYDVIYYGKKNHPEAEAILSLSDHIHLISNVEDIKKLDISNNRLFLTNQTTMSYLEMEEIFKSLKDRYPDIVIKEEICNATSSRQKAIMQLNDCDVLYVVGDIKSNNTSKLKEIGEKAGIKKVLMIQSYKDINENDLNINDKVCVTAGASTPPELINGVLNHLNELSSKSL